MTNLEKKEVYSSRFDIKKEPELKKELESGKYTFASVNHAFWRAQSDGITVTLYLSGKILVQGKKTEEFVNKYINKLDEVPQTTNSIEQKPTHLKYPSWIGTDESGKGDYFGPLIIAGVLVDKDNIDTLKEINVRDSKRINDEIIRKMAWKIRLRGSWLVSIYILRQ